MESKIVEWMLDPEASYPWTKKTGEEEMETHEQFLSMAGIMYSSLKENWKKASSEGERIEEYNKKITRVLFTKMPELLEYRQKYIQAAGMQAGYKQQRTQYKMTEDGKMHIIYIGEETKIADGKMTTEKTKQEQMDKNRGKTPKGNM